MNQYGAQILFGCAAVIALLLFVGDNSLSALHAMDERIAAEESYNQRLTREVSELKKSVYRLKKDDRYLEKYARREMGLAHADEVIYLFEEPRRVRAATLGGVGASGELSGRNRERDVENGRELEQGKLEQGSGHAAISSSQIVELQPAR